MRGSERKREGREGRLEAGVARMRSQYHSEFPVCVGPVPGRRDGTGERH